MSDLLDKLRALGAKVPKEAESRATRWARVLQSVEQGSPIEAAAAAAGLHSSVIYRWVAQDATGLLRTELETAAHLCEEKLARVITSIAFDPNAKEADRLRAAETWLKRRAGGRWSEIQAAVQQVLDAVRPMMSASAYDELIHAITRIEGMDQEQDSSDAQARH